MRGMVTSFWLVLLVAAGPVAGQAQGSHAVLDLLHSGNYAALGLGGDPFLSALDDETGWWSRIHESDQNAVGLRQVDYRPVAVQTGRETQVLTGQSTMVWLGRSLQLGDRRIRLQLETCAPRSEFALRGNDAGMRVAATGYGCDAWIRAEDVFPGITAQAGGTVWRKDESGASREQSIGLRGRVSSWLTAQAAFTKKQHPLMSHSDLLEEQVPMNLNLNTATLVSDLRLSLPFSLAIEGSHSTVELAEITAATSDDSYEMIPSGGAEKWHCAVKWQPTPSMRVMVRRTGMSLDVASDAYLASAKFARVKYLRGNGGSWLIGAEHRYGESTRILVDMESSALHGSGYGYVESWPFTSAVVDLLGASQRFRTSASADWARWHAGISREMGAGLLQGGLNWYHIRPRLTFETWQKTLLGNRAYERLELHSGSAELASVSLGVRWPLRGCHLDLAVHQFVYARSRVGSQSSASEDPESDPTLVAVPKSKGRAGTFLAFQLEHAF